MLLASFPSPGRSVWDLGPIPIRAYALCIILGIVAAIWITERRWVARGGRRGTVSDIAVWAVIFGLIGGRLYHVITDNELYFRAGRDPWRALYVWEGGLGVWGAIALGGVGAWIGCRRRGIKLPPFADAAAPGIAVAQGIGRWGNYFNQELFGRPTDVPWAVRIDPDRPSTVPGATGYHPTFLYESLWDLALAGVLIWVDRRYKMGRGRVFALYVMGYTAGRVWIEMLRIDTANHVLGLRLNVWTSIVVFAGGLAYFLLHPGPRETVVEPAPAGTPTPDAAATAATPPAATEDDPAAEKPPTKDSPSPADSPAEEATDAKSATDSTEATSAADSTEPKSAADSTEATSAADSTEVTSAADSTEATSAADSTEVTSAAEATDAESAADSTEVTSAAEATDAESAADVSGATSAGDSTGEEPAAAEEAQEPAAAEEPAAKAEAEAEAEPAAGTVPAEATADAEPRDEDADDAPTAGSGTDGDAAGEQRRRRLSPAGWRRR